jgi:hypothetical protein
VFIALPPKIGDSNGHTTYSDYRYTFSYWRRPTNLFQCRSCDLRQPRSSVGVDRHVRSSARIRCAAPEVARPTRCI